MKTDYKVGDWVIGQDCFLPFTAKLITSVSKNAVKYDKNNGCMFKYLRLATPEEIKAAGGKINSLQLNYLIL